MGSSIRLNKKIRAEHVRNFIKCNEDKYLEPLKEYLRYIITYYMITKYIDPYREWLEKVPKDILPLYESAEINNRDKYTNPYKLGLGSFPLKFKVPAPHELVDYADHICIDIKDNSTYDNLLEGVCECHSYLYEECEWEVRREFVELIFDFRMTTSAKLYDAFPDMDNYLSRPVIYKPATSLNITKAMASSGIKMKLEDMDKRLKEFHDKYYPVIKKMIDRVDAEAEVCIQ